MPVHYEHYLIPRDNTFRPTPEELSRLVNALNRAGFLGESRVWPEEVPATNSDKIKPIEPAIIFAAQLENGKYKPFPCPCIPEDFTTLNGREYRLVWPVENSDRSSLHYPLKDKMKQEGSYYDLEFHVLNDFVYVNCETIEPFEEELVCRCGRSLEFETWDHLNEIWGQRISRQCSWCGTPFRPQDLAANLWGGGKLQGGATYLFAIVVDCGRSYPDSDIIAASKQFLEVITKTLGQPFYEVGTVR